GGERRPRLQGGRPAAARAPTACKAGRGAAAATSAAPARACSRGGTLQSTSRAWSEDREPWRRPFPPPRRELAHREDLPEPHHEGEIAGDLILTVHERVTTALLAARDREPEVGAHRHGDRRLDRPSGQHAARAVLDDQRPLPRLTTGKVEENDRRDARRGGGVKQLREPLDGRRGRRRLEGADHGRLLAARA